MYKFVDTNEASGGVILPSEALQINGEYIENLIPGYRTLSVSGREALSPEISTYETGIRDGSVIKSRRYPARTITVKYQLITKDPETFREAYNKLAGILDVEEATLIFNDENDKFFTGTPSAIGAVDVGKKAVVGEFNLFCADPLKYSINEYEAEPVETKDDNRSFIINYNGTYKAFPTLEARFFDESEANEDGETENVLTGAGDCGYVAFFNDKGKIIQLGDPDELDGEELPKSQTLIHWDFMSKPKWGTAARKKWTENVGKTSDSVKMLQTGTVDTVQAYENAPADGFYLSAVDYGNGEKWHGPTITRTIPADLTGEVGASNFTLKYSTKIAMGDGTAAEKQLGIFQAILSSGSGDDRKIVAGVSVYKGSTGKKAELRFYVNGKKIYSLDIDLTMYNKYFGNNILADEGKGIKASKSVKTSYIEKIGNKVAFNVGGIKQVFTVADKKFTDLQVNEVTFTFMQWAERIPLSYNGLYYAKFTKHNCTTWREVPNKFSSADVITADCSTGEIFLNDAPSPQYGALGNDWEEFYLRPGVNQIGTSCSEWLKGKYVPECRVRYREVFL